MYHTSLFGRFAKLTARATGHPAAFAVALLTIVAWVVTGPIFGFSDTWQLVINTGTTIVTFLMVFLIQNTQNRDSIAVQLKLDELIRAMSGAHNGLLDLEELTEGELIKIRSTYEELARKAKQDLERGLIDTGTPNI
ncbi:MAG TPA: low affinity iron permease family protein [Chloroflexia bacterium]|jgi:low affinity Fe/Cu permease|nr:low affinity iron permease family protein [Chloroflexia bacterium]